MFTVSNLLIVGKASPSCSIAVRGVARIPHWEHHIRFDQFVGRKRPAQDVLDRFKRLNNGKYLLILHN